MAKVSLRIYNRDIESLIDQGQLDEAIAHCRHILQTFPKHLETYRLLGKAYLEAKRYSEAVDIFQRLLAAVPDDFVSHVGMSIIHDEEGRLNEAIWHMERAFEVQPSNAAIQVELQRLYGRRDGMEPPKIRMTRGALAHMYVKGELYPQAIAEIKAVLGQDPDRADMQTLLARAYFYAGQKADASEMCNKLLQRYPYCFDANRIMVELLQRSESVESTQVYRHRVIELDPYAAFTTGSIFYSNEVSDAAVSLERLVYQGQAVELGQDWGARSINLPQETAGIQPDWLSQPTGASFLEEKPTPVTPASSDIPDFLRQAGWTESSGAFQEGSTASEGEEESLAPAEIPDWLKAMAPEESMPASSTEEAVPSATFPDAGEQSEIPDWLQEISPAASGTAEEELSPADLPDWLKSLETPPEASAPSQAVESIQPEAPAESLPAAEIPDWLAGLEKSAEPESAQPEASAESLPAAPTPSVASLDTLGTTAEEQEDAIAWLESLAAKHGAKPEELVTNPEDRKEVPPAWVEQAKVLSETSPAQPQAPVTPPTESLPAAEIPDWLAGLEESAQPEAPAESLPAAEIPDWLAGLEESAQPESAQPEAPAESLPAAEIPDWLAGLEESAQPESAQPEAPAESLPAAEIPDWLAGLEESAQPESAQPEAPAESLPAAEIPDWLAGLEESAEPESAQPEAPAESLPAAEIPDWLAGLEKSAQPESAQPEAPAESLPAAPTPSVASLDTLGTTAEEQEDAIAWLESLAAKHGAKPEELVTNPEDRKEVPPAWVEQAKVLSETAPAQSQAPATPAEEPPLDETGMWLRELEEQETAETPSAELAEPSPHADEVPSWLRDTSRGPIAPPEPFGTGALAEQAAPSSEESPVAAGEITPLVEQESPAGQEELPPWLRSLEEEEEATIAAKPGEELPPWLRLDTEEPVTPAPISPDEWRPVEVIPQEEKQPPIEVKKPSRAVDFAVPPMTGQLTPQSPAVDTSATQAPSRSEPPPEPKKAPPPAAEPPRPVTRPRGTGMLTPPTDPALTTAQAELNRGNIPAALEHYAKLIKKGRWLEEIIRDLREALYRYPIEVTIWQTLGDAYMRANRLQEALDAYTKAEELLR